MRIFRRAAALAAVLPAALLCGPASAAAADPAGPPIPVSALVRENGSLHVLHTTAPSADEAQDLARRLEARPEVVEADVDVLLQVTEEPLRSQQWALSNLDAESAWVTGTGARAVIAVVDSGVDGTHPDLTDALVPGVDLLDSSQDGTTDPNGHGTSVAGVAAAQVNGFGGVGLAFDAQIMPVRVMDANGSGRSSTVAEGVLWAADHGADVINLSLGGPDSDDVLRAAIAEAVRLGSVVVAAAGNAGHLGNPTTYPGSYPEVIAVAAADINNQVAYFSSSGPWVDITGPGVSVAAPRANSGGQWARTSGTSIATPYVSASAALVVSAYPALSPAAVTTWLLSSATDLGADGQDDATGAGLVNPVGALVRPEGGPVSQPEPAQGPTPEPAPTQVPVPEPTPEPMPVPEPMPNPEPLPSLQPMPAAQEPVRRVGTSADVVVTAVAVSQAAFPQDRQASQAVLSRDDAFADSLAGTALAGRNGPILFTDGGPDAALRSDAAEELTRAVRPGGTVWILGGPNAVSATAEAQVQALGFEVRRLAGASRVETALAVALAVNPRPERVLLARSDGWADAVTGGAYAAANGVPVLLTNPDALHPAVAEALASMGSEVVLLGGEAALSPAVAEASGAQLRVAGESRVGTAVAVARELWGHTTRGNGDTFVAVEGWAADSWAPALAAAVLSAVEDGPQLLLAGDNSTPPAETVEYLAGLGYDAASPADVILVGSRLTDAHAARLAPYVGR